MALPTRLTVSIMICERNGILRDDGVNSEQNGVFLVEIYKIFVMSESFYFGTMWQSIQRIIRWAYFQFSGTKGTWYTEYNGALFMAIAQILTLSILIHCMLKYSLHNKSFANMVKWPILVHLGNICKSIKYKDSTPYNKLPVWKLISRPKITHIP